MLADGSPAEPFQPKTIVRFPKISTRAREHLPLQLTPLLHQLAHLVAVAHPTHVLLDDGPLVEVGRDVVRGGADQLHTPLLGLVVRARAHERGQEGVVDVDDAAGPALHERRREDLHVAGEHDQVYAQLVQEGELSLLGRPLVVRAHRDVREGHVEVLGDVLENVVVGDHAHDVAAQLPELLTE